MTGEATPIPIVPHTDSRAMQALPWRRQKDDKCDHILASNGKQVATFWGNDERHPQNMEWCTEAQRDRHIEYAVHACNNFPLMQECIEAIYAMEDMPEEAIKAIEWLMERTYREEIPPYAGKSR